MKSVEEAYTHLWHYTDAPGIQGILTSQTLWATSIFYLNDAEELTGFFDHKLKPLLKEGASKGISQIRETTAGRDHIESIGGLEIAENEFSKHLLDSLRSVTLNAQIYIASFCTPTGPNPDDGLLSQWRGYGRDGGYAVVFDSKGLKTSLDEECKTFYYAFNQWGDVDYDDDTDRHEETIEWESNILEATANLARASYDGEINSEIAMPFFQPILCLSTRHKHSGFREEAEVRIAFTTSVTGEPDKEALEADGNRQRKPIRFRSQNGILVPYISLFEGVEIGGKKPKLPIVKIVVGPHPRKRKRQQAIETMLHELQVDAPVVTSDIPYLGR